METEVEIGDRVTFVASYNGGGFKVYTQFITNASELDTVERLSKNGGYRIAKIERPVYETKFYWHDLSEKEKIELTTEWNKRANETRIKRLQQELEEEKNKTWIERLFEWLVIK